MIHLPRFSFTIILATLAGAGAMLWAGQLHAASGILQSPAYHKVTMYQGVAAITTNTWDILEIGNNGSDIASTGTINIRPNGTDETKGATMTRWVNPSWEALGELDVNGLCFAGVSPAVCVYSGTVAAGDDTYWKSVTVGSSSVLSPKAATDGVQIGTTNTATALSTSALEVYANTDQQAAIFNNNVVTSVLSYDGGGRLVYTGGGNMLLNGQVTVGVSSIADAAYTNLMKYHQSRVYVGQKVFSTNPSPAEYPYLGGNGSGSYDNLTGQTAEPWTSNDFYSFNPSLPQYKKWSGIDADTIDSKTPNLDFLDTSVHPVELFWKYWETGSENVALCVKTDKAALCSGGTKTGKPCSVPADCPGGGTCQAMCKMALPQPTCPADPSSLGVPGAPTGVCANSKRCDGSLSTICQTDDDCWVGYYWHGPCGYGPVHTANDPANPVDVPKSCLQGSDCPGSKLNECIHGILQAVDMTIGRMTYPGFTDTQICQQTCKTVVKCQGASAGSCVGSSVKYNISYGIVDPGTLCTTFYYGSVAHQQCQCDCALGTPTGYSTADTTPGSAGAGDLCSGSTAYDGQFID